MARDPTDLASPAASSFTTNTTSTSKSPSSQLPYQTSPSPNPPTTTTPSHPNFTPTPTLKTIGTGNDRAPFRFPPSHSFPPFYTLQPNPTTRHAQFQKWSRIILSYCSHHRHFRLSIPACLSFPLFRNESIRRRLDERAVREVLGWMSSVGTTAADEGGGGRVEWINEPGVGKRAVSGPYQCYVFWKRPEEWAESIYSWVEATGQKGTVLTEWEMLEGEAARGEEFWAMDGELFSRALGILVKRGKAQVFGSGGDEGRGVKFF